MFDCSSGKRLLDLHRIHNTDNLGAWLLYNSLFILLTGMGVCMCLTAAPGKDFWIYIEYTTLITLGPGCYIIHCLFC